MCFVGLFFTLQTLKSNYEDVLTVKNVQYILHIHTHTGERAEMFMT